MSDLQLVAERVRLHRPSRLDAGTPAGYAELLIRTRIDRARARVIHDRRDLGASVIEWVIISALVVGISVTIGGLLLDKMKTKVDDINLTTNTK